MSFSSTSSYSPQERDTNPYVNEPVLNKEAKTFEQELLTVSDHQNNADGHWIGEALPAASTAAWGVTGASDFTGVSPFPARVDHTHDGRAIFGIYISGAAINCPPGQTFFNQWLPAGGRDMRAPASQQVFIMPQEGMWAWIINAHITRQVAGAFAGGAFNLVAFFDNGTSNRIIDKPNTTNIVDVYDTGAIEAGYILTNPGPTRNIQFAIQHADVVGWTVNALYLTMFRMSSAVSA